MKDFFSEYGFLALAAIVVVILIAMASPVGAKIKEYVLSLVGKFGNASEGWVNQMDAIGTDLTNSLAE